MNWIKNAGRALLWSNVFVAVCAAALTFESSYLLTAKFKLTSEVWLVFFGTLAVYNFHRLLKWRYANKIGKKPAINRYFLLFLLVFALVAIWPFVLNIALNKVFAFGLCALIAVFYSFGLPWIGMPAWRKWPMLKSFNIAVIWTIVTAVVPNLDDLGEEHLTGLIAERFFFLMAVALPFDIRDLKADRMDGLQTLPVKFGNHITKLISSGCLMVFLVLVTYAFKTGFYSFSIWTAFCASFVFTTVAVWNSKTDGNDFYYGYFLDGSNLFQPMVILLSVTIC